MFYINLILNISSEIRKKEIICYISYLFLFVHPPTHWSIHQFIDISIQPPIHPSTHSPIYPSIHLRSDSSINPYVYTSIHQYIYIYLDPSMDSTNRLPNHSNQSTQLNT